MKDDAKVRGSVTVQRWRSAGAPARGAAPPGRRRGVGVRVSGQVLRRCALGGDGTGAAASSCSSSPGRAVRSPEPRSATGRVQSQSGKRS